MVRQSAQEGSIWAFAIPNPTGNKGQFRLRRAHAQEENGDLFRVSERIDAKALPSVRPRTRNQHRLEQKKEVRALIYKRFLQSRLFRYAA